MKYYLITGGTGLIGSAICKQLIQQGHDITVLSRTPQKAVSVLGNTVTCVQTLNDIDDSQQIDVIINLAGAPIADQRWSKSRKQILEQSRVDLTANLVEWLANRNHKPECLISGSAVGWYGDGGDSVLTESSEFHDEYTHQLCEAWEQQALRAEQYGIRVCIVRTGLVLANNGGFLKKMLLPFKLGLGANLGDGQQYMPWIHINDIVNLFIFLANTQAANGIFNGCAPQPVKNKAFTESLARHLHRPALFSIPSWVLELGLGEMSRLLLTGQNAIPERAHNTGFKFEFSDLDAALADIFNRSEQIVAKH